MNLSQSKDKAKLEKWRREFLIEQKRAKRKWAWQFTSVVFSLLLLAFVGRGWYTGDIYFWARDYDYTEALVTDTKMRHIGRGYYLQRVYYEFHYQDIYYTGTFQSGKSFGLQKVGNRLKVKFVLSDPSYSKVVGFYP